MRLISILLLGLMLGAQPLALAEQPLRQTTTDSRIKIVAYDENNVTPIHTQAFTTLQIDFHKTETILSIHNGDSAAWAVEVDPHQPNNLFLKPTVDKSETNMTVITDKRHYYFHLIASAEAEKNALTYAVRFIYPEQDKEQQLQAIKRAHEQHAAEINEMRQPDSYHWNYSFHGSKKVMPAHVFDDGQWTYLQLRPRQAIPAIFVVDNKAGDETLVNSRREGDYLVIPRIAPQFTLRHGKHHVASLFNQRLLKAARRGA